VDGARKWIFRRLRNTSDAYYKGFACAHAYNKARRQGTLATYDPETNVYTAANMLPAVTASAPDLTVAKAVRSGTNKLGKDVVEIADNAARVNPLYNAVRTGTGMYLAGNAGRWGWSEDGKPGVLQEAAVGVPGDAAFGATAKLAGKGLSKVLTKYAPNLVQRIAEFMVPAGALESVTPKGTARYVSEPYEHVGVFGSTTPATRTADLPVEYADKLGYLSYLSKAGKLRDALRNPDKYLNDADLVDDFMRTYGDGERGVSLDTKWAASADHPVLQHYIRMGKTGVHGSGTHLTNTSPVATKFSHIGLPNQQAIVVKTKLDLPGMAEAASPKERLDVLSKFIRHSDEGAYVNAMKNPESVTRLAARPSRPRLIYEGSYAPGDGVSERFIPQAFTRKYPKVVNFKVHSRDMVNKNWHHKGEWTPSNNMYLYDDDIVNKAIDAMRNGL